MEGSSSEIRIIFGFGLGFGDSDLGVWKKVWISGEGWGICWRMGMWKGVAGIVRAGNGSVLRGKGFGVGGFKLRFFSQCLKRLPMGRSKS